METLIHKTSGGERGGNSSSNIQYSSMSNANVPSTTQINSPTQIVMPQPAPITKAAKPVRDSAQFVN